MRKTPFLFIVILFCLPAFSQPSKFSLITGNNEEIVCSFLDRKTNELVTLDKAGFVVTWDVTNMSPVKRFATIPFNPFSNDKYNYLNQTYPVIKANKKVIWITYNAHSPSNTEITDVYDRETGKYFGQTDTAFIERIHYTSNNDFIIARSRDNAFFQNNEAFYGILSRQNNGDSNVVSINLKKKAACIELSNDEKYVAVGYQFGGVDVFDAKTFKLVLSSMPKEPSIVDHVHSIKFLPANEGIVYCYGSLLNKNIYLQRFSDKEVQSITLPEDGAHTKLEVSISGKYLGVSIANRHAWIYNLQEKRFENKRPISNVDYINNIHFLTDEVLLTCGNEQAGKNSWYSYSASEASIRKMDWRNNLWSDNLAQDPLNAILKKGEITVYNDSCYSISEGNKWSQYLNLSTLENKFFASQYEYTRLLDAAANTLGYKTEIIPFGYNFQQGVVQNDADSFYNYVITPLDVKTSLLMKQDISSERLVEGIPIKPLDKYSLFKVNTNSEMAIWKPEGINNVVAFTVTNFEGKKFIEDSVGFIFTNTIKFSPDGKWLCYQKNNSEITVCNIETKRKKTFRTGASQMYYNESNVRLESTSAKLIFETFNSNAPNAFTLVSVNLLSGKQDTLVNLQTRPYTYGLDRAAEKISMSFPIDFADTAFWKNAQKVEQAAKYKFRSMFKPLIMYMDLKTGEGGFINVKNQTQPEKLAIANNKIISLQADGLVYYYDIADTSKVAMHFLQQNEHAIINRDYYYATPALVKNIEVKTPGRSIPVGKQDILFNQPQEVMNYFASQNTSLKKLFQAAYNKRIAQFDRLNSNSLNRPAPIIMLDEASRNKLLVTEETIKCRLQVSEKGSSVSRLFVKVNEYPVYGKEGLAVNNKKEIDISIPLDSGYNNVSIQAMDENGHYSVPATATWFANFTPVKTKRKLWVFAAGVSKYADTAYNLSYAAKDATDFSKLFQYKDNFDTTIVHLLTNEQVTSQSFIKQLNGVDAAKNDVVIVYLAGHGLLDSSANFFYATHNIDFKHPSVNGLSYTAMVNAIDQLPARNKVLFLDACHSGMVDRSRLANTATTIAPSTAVTLQGTRSSLKNVSNNYREQDVFLFMQKIFSDLSSDNSVNILSASLGNSYALESPELQNGLFTYALIKAVGLAKASDTTNSVVRRNYAEGSTIRIKDIQEYLGKEVMLLSKGAQTPSFITNKTAVTNIVFGESSFPSYLFSNEGEEKDYKTFLDKYKKDGL